MESEYVKQANEFATKVGLTMNVEYFDYGYHFVGDKDQRHIFKITLKRNKKRYTFKFGQSLNAGKVKPTLYDILACLTKYDVGSINEFCGEFGYDLYIYTNNGRYVRDKKIVTLYNNVCKEFEAIDRLFSDVMDELCEIQ